MPRASATKVHRIQRFEAVSRNRDGPLGRILCGGGRGDSAASRACSTPARHLGRAGVRGRPGWHTWLFILIVWALCGGWLLATRYRPAGARRRARPRHRNVRRHGHQTRSRCGVAGADHRGGSISRAAAGPAADPLVTLVVAVVLWLVARAEGAAATLTQALSLVVHASVVLVHRAGHRHAAPLRPGVADEPVEPGAGPAPHGGRHAAGAVLRRRSICSRSGGWRCSPIGLSVLTRRRVRSLRLAVGRRCISSGSRQSWPATHRGVMEEPNRVSQEMALGIARARRHRRRRRPAYFARPARRRARASPRKRSTSATSRPSSRRPGRSIRRRRSTSARSRWAASRGWRSTKATASRRDSSCCRSIRSRARARCVATKPAWPARAPGSNSRACR